MEVGAISAAALSQDVLSSSNTTHLQQALDALQSSLSSGDLNGAQTAFGTLQKLNQNLATASGTSLSSNSQLSTDLTTLGSALGSGNLSTAKSAFVTVQNDLKQSTSPSQTNEVNVASQSVQLVNELLSPLNADTTSSGTSDSTTSVLERVYGNPRLNVLG